MVGVRKERVRLPALRGLGREVEPDTHVVDPQLHPCLRLLVDPEGRALSVSWVRSARQALHSVRVDYGYDAVRVGVRLGTREPAADRNGQVLRMIIEHTTIRLREPLRGRRLESLATSVTHSR